MSRLLGEQSITDYIIFPQIIAGVDNYVSRVLHEESITKHYKVNRVLREESITLAEHHCELDE